MRLTFVNPHPGDLYKNDTGMFCYVERTPHEFDGETHMLFKHLVIETLVEGRSFARLQLDSRQGADLLKHLQEVEEIAELECKCRKEMYCPIHGDW